MKRLALGLVIAAALAALILRWLGGGGLGERWGAGAPNPTPIPEAQIESRAAVQHDAASLIGVVKVKQILFGDLHVHSTFSIDAFMMALPLSGGEGAHPVSDACDFARHCSALDFWSINDHALALDSEAWRETVEAIRQCNEVAGDPANPDITAFLGWEWTQMGSNPDNHYGHKNVIIRGLSDEEIPTRPIGASPPADAFDRQTNVFPGKATMGLLQLTRPNGETADMIRYFNSLVADAPCEEGVAERDLPDDCKESAADPAALFAKLDDWGFDSLLIPHGTTWGFYTPQGSAWDKQLNSTQHDPKRQTMVEVYSGHGNSEEYRPWREVAIGADGSRSCPEPRKDFLPSCWRAGEIIAQRCREAGEDEGECQTRAGIARRHYVEGDLMGHLTVPGAQLEEWLDSGQCRDCFQPSFNYRPRSSVQYMMALRNFEDPENPERFDFGFMASSDNHTARPGTGFKEFGRVFNTEARLTTAGVKVFGGLLPMEVPPPGPRSIAFDPASGGAFFNLRESERASSFFLTGGLIGLHSEGRSRDEIWQAMERKEVYGTSGPRILLWFDLLNPPGSVGQKLAMGGHTPLAQPPIFQVRAVGSLEQVPGCPDAALDALGADNLERLCRDECYNPGNRRRLITRIEIVRIRPQVRPEEPVDNLIEDPWQVFECAPNPDGCSITFSDPAFLTSGRDTLYYVRAIEEPSLAINAGLLRCDTDDDGRCVSTQPCTGDTDPADDCLAQTEQRAWSSPIFLQTVPRS